MVAYGTNGQIYQNFSKSRRSQPDANCVEVAYAADGSAAMRDSKDPQGPILKFSVDAFAEFLAAVKRGEFDQ